VRRRIPRGWVAVKLESFFPIPCQAALSARCAELRHFLFFHELLECLGDGLVVGIVLFSFRSETAFHSLIVQCASLATSASTASCNAISPRSRISNDFPHVNTSHGLVTTQTMTAGVGVLACFSLFGGKASLSSHFIERNTFATDFLSRTEEALARVAFGEQRLVFIPELIPEVVEIVIMGPPDNMRELMKKSVRDLFYRQELA